MHCMQFRVLISCSSHHSKFAQSYPAAVFRDLGVYVDSVKQRPSLPVSLYYTSYETSQIRSPVAL